MRFVLVRNFQVANPDDNCKNGFLYLGSCVCIEHFEQHLCDLVDSIDDQNPALPCHTLFQFQFSIQKQTEKQK